MKFLKWMLALSATTHAVEGAQTAEASCAAQDFCAGMVQTGSSWDAQSTQIAIVGEQHVNKGPALACLSQLMQSEFATRGEGKAVVYWEGLDSDVRSSSMPMWQKVRELCREHDVTCRGWEDEALVKESQKYQQYEAHHQFVKWVSDNYGTPSLSEEDFDQYLLHDVDALANRFDNEMRGIVESRGVAYYANRAPYVKVIINNFFKLHRFANGMVGDRTPVQKMIDAMFKQYLDLMTQLHEQYPTAVPAMSALSYQDLDRVDFSAYTQGPLSTQRSKMLVNKATGSARKGHPVIVSTGIFHALDANEYMEKEGKGKTKTPKTSLFVDGQVVKQLEQLAATGYPLPGNRQLPEVHAVMTCSVS